MEEWLDLRDKGRRNGQGFGVQVDGGRLGERERGGQKAAHVGLWNWLCHLLRGKCRGAWTGTCWEGQEEKDEWARLVLQPCQKRNLGRPFR